MRLNLCLGTAQLGGDYGITNKKGKPSNKEIDLIIKSALKNNIFYFDTANAYGNSETILGNKLNDKNIKLITKFKSGVKDSFSEEDIVNLEKNFKETLKRLRTNKIDSYLLHDSNDLKKGGTLTLPKNTMETSSVNNQNDKLTSQDKSSYCISYKLKISKDTISNKIIGKDEMMDFHNNVDGLFWIKVVNYNPYTNSTNVSAITSIAGSVVLKLHFTISLRISGP